MVLKGPVLRSRRLHPRAFIETVIKDESNVSAVKIVLHLPEDLAITYATGKLITALATTAQKERDKVTDIALR
jgi:hypothetical protein